MYYRTMSWYIENSDAGWKNADLLRPLLIANKFTANSEDRSEPSKSSEQKDADTGKKQKPFEGLDGDQPDKKRKKKLTNQVKETPSKKKEKSE